jgi:hypothetical protein
MQKLNLPEYSFKITTSENNRQWIYDSFRKKDILLTPEEWVRQNILCFLVKEKMYPATLISIESGIKVNRMTRRYDALVYNRKGNPIMLVECKAPEVQISQDTFDQISAYNLTVLARYLLLTNGISHYCCMFNEQKKSFDFLEVIPFYEEL